MTSTYECMELNQLVLVQLLKTAKDSAERDNQRMHARKVLIEKKKEEQERLLLQAEKEEEERRAVQERLSVAAEEERRRLDRSLTSFTFFLTTAL